MDLLNLAWPSIGGATAGPSFIFTTFDPATLGPQGILSNGNLTFTSSSGGGQNARSIVGKNSGKWYWEYHPSSPFLSLGIINVLGNQSSNIGDTVHSYAYRGNFSQLKHDGINYGAVTSYTSGDVIGVALDMDTLKLQFYKNNIVQGPNHTILTGTYHAGVSGVQSGGVQSVTANFGATALVYTPPVGFNAGIF